MSYRTTHLIKPDPDTDLYVRWSRTGCTPVEIGTRAEYEAVDVDPVRLDRADATGASDLPPHNLGEWADPAQAVLMVATAPYEKRLLPRERVADYARAVFDGRLDDAHALTHEPDTARPDQDTPQTDEPKPTAPPPARPYDSGGYILTPGGDTILAALSRCGFAIGDGADGSTQHQP